ncbi:MAG: hypothetical protein HFH61_04250 [Lachnospiraceae bacterium]|nr:hypothetical protein [Lachnospiraceae bacterium]
MPFIKDVQTNEKHIVTKRDMEETSGWRMVWILPTLFPNVFSCDSYGNGDRHDWLGRSGNGKVICSFLTAGGGKFCSVKISDEQMG